MPQAVSSPSALERAIQAHSHGRLDEAESWCREILRADPDHFDALHLLGLAQAERGRYGEALVSLDRALAVRPDDDQALSNRGLALEKLGRADDALANYARAVALRPDNTFARYNRGRLLLEVERLDEALADFDAALASQPDFPAALNNRGRTLFDLKRFKEAVASYDRALALDPSLAAAHANRAAALHKLRRFNDAIAGYDRALALEPDNAETHYDRAMTLRDAGRPEEALGACERALELQPDLTRALCLRAQVLQEENRVHDAIAAYDRVLAVEPGHAIARLGRCMAELPVLFRNAAEIAERRAGYERQLCGLRDDVERSGDGSSLVSAIGQQQPFYLPYQARNDRDLQAVYGELVCRIIASKYGEAPLPPAPTPGEKLRVGIVSGMFRRHVNWKQPISGWLGQLDRSRFRLFGYYTGELGDDATRTAAELCERFVEGPLDVARWRQEILSDAPHVLIYPEIGMDTTVPALAAQRLARIQCSAWGHPQTSGMPTIDYFLSSALMEPPDGDSHYTERLVRLPNLSIYYEPLEEAPAAMSRADHGLRPEATLFWCCQSIFKYLPQYDSVFPRIARGAGDCQFVFIENKRNPDIIVQFRDRLVDAFAAEGLDCDAHCAFLPSLKPDEFAGMTGVCDIFLDSIDWSGGNTTLESLPYDMPIVTLPGSLMRGRHSAAILEMMDVRETIARDLDEYVAIAVRLARDKPWRATIKAKIAANKHRVYRDRAAIAGLEAFLEHAARGA